MILLLHGESASSGVPQFATAEYSGRSGDVTCKSCAQKISGTFYRVNGAPVCAECTQRLQQTMPQDSHQRFVRGVLFGAGAAVAGFAIYVVFAIATGLIAGIVSLAVGYLVGKAIERGSGGVGGRRYQIAAALLTYMAVSLAAVPIALSVHMKHNSAQQQAQAAAPAATPAAAPEATRHPRQLPQSLRQQLQHRQHLQQHPRRRRASPKLLACSPCSDWHRHSWIWPTRCTALSA